MCYGRPMASIRHVMIADPQVDIAQRVTSMFSGQPVRVQREGNVDRLFEHFERRRYDVLIIVHTKSHLGDMDIVDLVSVLRVKSPATQILLLAEKRVLKQVMKALHAGAYQYAVLPVPNEELRLLIEAALAQFAGEAQRDVEPVLAPKDSPLFGSSPSMEELYRLIRQAASTDIPVLILGETGTGKELVAREIQQQSERRDGPYVPVHLGALPPELVPSELFGHERGAFTGAHGRHLGKFEEANDGTIFLDEVGTLDEKVQISLLRLLEQKKFTRLGGRKTLSSNARVIAATNEDLWLAVQAGTFREDLYYRLDVFHVFVPPLRDRKGDIAILVQEFIRKYNVEFDRQVQGLEPELLRQLEAHDWPGNVRELKNVIQRAVLVCNGETLRVEHLPPRLQRRPERPRSVVIEIGTPLAEVERKLLAKTLAVAPTKKDAAEMLGISRRALYNKMDRYGLNP